eukprot:16215-Heterococcus_DN1.PRE.2
MQAHCEQHTYSKHIAAVTYIVTQTQNATQTNRLLRLITLPHTARTVARFLEQRGLFTNAMTRRAWRFGYMSAVACHWMACVLYSVAYYDMKHSRFVYSSTVLQKFINCHCALMSPANSEHDCCMYMTFTTQCTIANDSNATLQTWLTADGLAAVAEPVQQVQPGLGGTPH